MAGEQQPQGPPADEPQPPAPPPDDAVVVRGGLLRYDDFVDGLEVYESIDPHPYAAIDPAAYAASFFCWPGHTADEIVSYVRGLGQRLLLHENYRASTVGALRAAGYELVVTNWYRRHCSLFFDAIPSEADFGTLRAAFGAAVHNPA